MLWISINTLRRDSTHPDTYNLVGFSGCLHLWWIPLLTPEICVTSVTMNQISLTTRLALNEFWASCYSHHKSQSALSETNWLLRVSRCNLNLNPYLVIQMGHHHGHPLTGAMELRPDHWSAALGISPRDPQGLTHWHRPNNHKSTIREYQSCSQFHVNLWKITSHSYHMLNPHHSSSPPHEYRASSHINIMSHKYQLTH